MRSRRGARLVLGAVGGILALGTLSDVARADTDGEAEPADVEQINALIAIYMTEVNTADLDGDGEADFADVDGDGFPDAAPPEGFPGDLDVRPGDGRFGDVVLANTDLSAEDWIESQGTTEKSWLLHDCSGMAWSYDSDGDPVDAAIGVGSREGGGPTGQLWDIYPADDFGKRAFTKDNPFVVKDRVVYFGRMPSEGDGARNHTWDLSTAGISIDEGGDDNPDLDNRNAGEVSVSDDVPGGSFTVPTGIYPVTGDLDSENGVECAGSGWVKFETGNPLATGAGVVGKAAVLAGVLGLLFNSRPATTWKA